MNRVYQLLFCVVLAGGSFLPAARAQFSVGADFVSRYLWRGQLLASGPALQPSLAFATSFDTAGVFGAELGAWGSYGLGSGFDGTEADLYLTLAAGPLSITFTDYYFPSDSTFATASDNYLKYGPSEETGHVFEGMVSLEGLGGLPFSASVAYNFAGADLQNSLFVDLSYTLDAGVELGLSLGNGWYTFEQEGEEDSFGLVNLSVGYSRPMALSPKYALPVFGRVALNPDLEKLYIVFGVSF